jgi:hypothetical protein
MTFKITKHHPDLIARLNSANTMNEYTQQAYFLRAVPFRMNALFNIGVRLINAIVNSSGSLKNEILTMNIFSIFLCS